MTEMGPAVTFTRGNIEDTKGSTGQLLPNMKYKISTMSMLENTECYISIRMKVLDLGTGEEMNVGETGELCFTGPQASWETELQEKSLF